MEANNEIVRIAFYIRVSTDEQAKDWYGLEYQKDALRRLYEFRQNQMPVWSLNEKYIYIDADIVDET